MKRAFGLLICICFLGFCLLSQAQASSRLSFRITGGLNWLDGGDLNAGAEGVFDFYEYFAALLGVSHEGDFSPARLGMNFGGELVFMITPRVGVGLGAGMLSAVKNPAMEWTDGGDRGEMRYRIKASAVPIRLSFHYVIPASSRMNVFLNAGLGAYPAKVEYSVIWTEDGSPTGSFGLDASKLGMGFHGGMGLECALTTIFGIVAELAGRYSSFAGFDAEVTDGTESGQLYYLESDFLSRTFATLAISDTKPPGSNVREAKISFTGFSVTAGFFIRF